jgi:hypothetical protein
MATCSICGAEPCINPSFCRACRNADKRKARGDFPHYIESDRLSHIESERLERLRRLMSSSVSLDAAWAELNGARNRPTPKATIEAVMYAVRERGLAALKEPTTAERLERCDAAARAEINQRIEMLGLKS